MTNDGAGVVTDYKAYQVPGQASLDAVAVSNLAGLWPGEERFVVRTKARLYDCSLFFSPDLSDSAQAIYAEFIRQFQFE